MKGIWWMLPSSRLVAGSARSMVSSRMFSEESSTRTRRFEGQQAQSALKRALVPMLDDTDFFILAWVATVMVDSMGHLLPFFDS